MRWTRLKRATASIVPFSHSFSLAAPSVHNTKFIRYQYKYIFICNQKFWFTPQHHSSAPHKWKRLLEKERKRKKPTTWAHIAHSALCSRLSLLFCLCENVIYWKFNRFCRAFLHFSIIISVYVCCMVWWHIFDKYTRWPTALCTSEKYIMLVVCIYLATVLLCAMFLRRGVTFFFALYAPNKHSSQQIKQTERATRKKLASW